MEDSFYQLAKKIRQNKIDKKEIRKIKKEINKINKAIFIQKNIRGFLSRKKIKNFIEEKNAETIVEYLCEKKKKRIHSHCYETICYFFHKYILNERKKKSEEIISKYISRYKIQLILRSKSIQKILVNIAHYKIALKKINRQKEIDKQIINDLKLKMDDYYQEFYTTFYIYKNGNLWIKDQKIDYNWIAKYLSILNQNSPQKYITNKNNKNCYFKKKLLGKFVQNAKPIETINSQRKFDKIIINHNKKRGFSKDYNINEINDDFYLKDDSLENVKNYNEYIKEQNNKKSQKFVQKPHKNNYLNNKNKYNNNEEYNYYYLNNNINEKHINYTKRGNLFKKKNKIENIRSMTPDINPKINKNFTKYNYKSKISRAINSKDKNSHEYKDNNMSYTNIYNTQKNKFKNYNDKPSMYVKKNIDHFNYDY